MLLGDFNLTIENKHLEELLNLFNLKGLVSSPTWVQSINSTCIDLILTNQEDLFSNYNTCEVGISDHHHLVSTMLSKKNLKSSTKTLFYRDYKKFEENKFARDFTHEGFQNIKNLSDSHFEKAFVTVLVNHAPLKKKQLRFNHSHFMTKSYNVALVAQKHIQKNLMTIEINIKNKEILLETPSQNKTGLLR